MCCFLLRNTMLNRHVKNTIIPLVICTTDAGIMRYDIFTRVVHVISQITGSINRHFSLKLNEFYSVEVVELLFEFGVYKHVEYGQATEFPNHHKQCLYVWVIEGHGLSTRMLRYCLQNLVLHQDSVKCARNEHHCYREHDVHFIIKKS